MSYTIAEIDAAVEAITGRPVLQGASMSRPHRMLDAAAYAWIHERPEDAHARILREGILDLNRTGFLHPHDGVWP